MNSKKVDHVFLWIVLSLVFGGFFLFLSASLGLLAREGGASFENVFVSQVVLGLFLGSFALFFISRLHYKYIRKFSFFLFLFGIVLTIGVFIPGIGFGHGGAKRWIDVGFTTFQPSEVLKLGFVLYFASWLGAAKDRVNTFKHGTVPFLALLIIPAILLVLEPDVGTFGVIAAAGGGMFIVAGGNLKHLGIMFMVAVLAFPVVVHYKPYLRDRIDTFLNPENDPQGTGYQINQSLIAIGSGQIFGRGFGQSIQKFSSLPEPTNDSIFAVASEEFGFLGSSAIVLLFLFFAMRGLHIAGRAPDRWGRITVTGIVLLVITQSFINIASMVGLFPLTGVPLIFISHGGTALFFALAEVGIILSISRYKTAPVLPQ